MDQLRSDFVFYQSNLQDYVDCPYLFYLKHVARVSWPALLSDDDLLLEIAFRRGRLFHDLVLQHSLGIPIEWLSALAKQESIDQWWNNYLTFGIAAVEKEEHRLGISKRYYEIPLQVELDGYRLGGVLDLLLIGSEGRACIFDWKSGSKKIGPKLKEQLAGRVQTKCYSLLVTLARSLPILSKPIHSVRMVYWYAENPQHPVVLDIDQTELEANRRHFLQLFHQITETKEYAKTAYIQRCSYCRYRSYCERGERAFSLEEDEENFEFIADMEDAYSTESEVAFGE